MKNKLLFFIIIILLIIVIIHNSCSKKEYMHHIKNFASQSKPVLSTNNYECKKHEDDDNIYKHETIDNDTKNMIIDLRDLDEYEYNYNKYVNFINVEKHRQTYLKHLIDEEKNQLERNHAIVECAQNCNISTTELIEKLTQLQHLHSLENGLKWQEMNLDWIKKLLPRYKKNYEYIENNLGKFTVEYINRLEKLKNKNDMLENNKLNDIKLYIERLDNFKQRLNFIIKISENRLKYLSEHINMELEKINNEKKILKYYEECTKYCNTCSAFNKLNNLIWSVNESNMIPSYIKNYDKQLKNIDREINYEKRKISQNPEIRNYLDCRNSCDDGKIPINKPDSCDCIKHITNKTLHKFIECTTHCDDLDPTLCYNRCVDNTVHEKIFNDRPMWWFNLM